MSKWFVEVVRDPDGTYKANLNIEGKRVQGLPENVDYTTLRDAIKKLTGIEILKKKDMIFESGKWNTGCKYAYIDNTQERADCRVTLDEIYPRSRSKKGWRPKFTEPVTGDAVFIYPKGQSCNIDAPYILGGIVLSRTPSVELFDGVFAATASIHITDRFNADGTYQNMDEIQEYYDSPSLYEPTLEAAQDKASKLYEKIDQLKSLPRISEPAVHHYGGPYASDYFDVLDIKALSDGQLSLAKDLSKEFTGTFNGAIVAELKKRFISEVLETLPKDSRAMSLAEKIGYAKARAEQGKKDSTPPVHEPSR